MRGEVLTAVMPEQQDLLDYYLEMKRLKAVMDNDTINHKDKESIIVAFSKAVDSAFARLRKIVEEIEMVEKRAEE